MVSNLITLMIAFLIPFIIYSCHYKFSCIVWSHTGSNPHSHHIQPPPRRKDNDCQGFFLHQIYSQFLYILYRFGVSCHYKLYIKLENHQKSACLNWKLLDHPCGRLYDLPLFECFQSCHAHRTTLLAIVIFNVLTDTLVKNTFGIIAIQTHSINRIS